MAANLPRSRSIGPVRFIRTEDGLGVSAGVGRVRISRTPTGLVTRTVHRPGTVVDTTTVLNAKRHAVAAGSEGDPPESRRAAAQRRRAGAMAAADEGDGATHDLRNGCLGCGGLLLLLVLLIVGLASCVGGSGGFPFTGSSTTPMGPTAVSSPHGSGDPNASSTDASSSRSAFPPGMTDVSSPSPSAPRPPAVPSTSVAPLPRPTSRPLPTTSRRVPAPSRRATPTRRPPAPTTRAPRPAPSPTRTRPSSPSCYPQTPTGDCYHVGDYCDEWDVGFTGVDAYGRPITCMPFNDFGIWI